MNAIGTQLRDLINSGLTRWCLAVLHKYMDAAAKLGRNPVSKHHTSVIILIVEMMSRLARDETAELVSRDQILRRERGQGFVFPLFS